MKNLRVLVLVREGLVPPETLEGSTDKQIAEWRTEYDVVTALKKMGHEVRTVGVYDDLGPIRDAIHEWKPHVAFMLLEEFHGVGTYDHAVVSYLELMRQPYTGCNPLGMMLSRDKGLAKKIMTWHRIPNPHFAVYELGRVAKRTRQLEFPLVVKSANEHASLGISQASIVTTDEALAERVRFVHDTVHSDALVEEYIAGREFYVGVLGNKRLETTTVWEMDFSNMPDDAFQIASAKVKWDEKYQKRHRIATHAAKNLPEGVEAEIPKLCKRVYRALRMTGYARLDFRMRADGRLYVLEANANPNLSHDEDFAESAAAAGVPYEELLARIINLGMRHAAPWKA